MSLTHEPKTAIEICREALRYGPPHRRVVVALLGEATELLREVMDLRQRVATAQRVLTSPAASEAERVTAARVALAGEFVPAP